ncbi:MAG TPA: hypothetical protein VG106_11085 [Vicinamibacterales bacterium]|nr:hypothetical protein [Vicinamibacterales bacterium]
MARTTEHPMPIWGRLKQELDRASRVAQDAIDEGRVRLEVFRARQRADRAAQALGYAVHRAHKDGRELGGEELERLAGEVTRVEAEITRLESQLTDLRAHSAGATGGTSSDTASPPATI